MATTHPNLLLFIHSFEQEAVRNKSYRKKLGEIEMLFLQQVWSPGFEYDFAGLRVEYPLKDAKGGQRFIDFVYLRNGVRIVIEIDGFTTHARDISPAEFEDHLERQNDLALSGWLILRFASTQVQKNPLGCLRQIKQAIGHWWSLTHGSMNVKEIDLWELRKQQAIYLAQRNGGWITPVQLATEFTISRRSSLLWLHRFAGQGTFQPVVTSHRVNKYRLADYLCN
ncbi:endonuclease domain-containing protein [Paenibacillus koleovorans]|uniref:endonuclease domain-containing protein n=1 Tax=Paenibacillus koleovorans TaxID=121608 RepID=UPI000FDADC99|nr:DUF559 domain-containing protein [Paenibacillus koleovorans]